MHDTIFAPATPLSAAPAALIRISGPHVPALAQVLLGAPFRYRSFETSVGTTLGRVPCRAWLLPAPRTFTGENMLELRVPGNPRLVARLEERLLALGARRADAGEFTRRALAAGKLDVSRAEAVGALINAQGEAERRQALADLAGRSARELAALAERLRAVSAGYELAFDFSEDEPEPAPFETLAANLHAVGCSLAEFCANVPHRPRRDRAVIALFGLPNAGKSSLFNALLGSRRALVSELPGTTRDPVRAPLTLAGQGCELRDLSGVGTTDADQGRFAETARSEAVGADLLLLVCAPGQRDQLLREFDVLLERERDIASRALWVNTMSDVAAPQYAPPGLESVTVSALTGAGLVELRAAMGARLAAQSRGAATSQLRVRAQEALLALQQVEGHAPPEALALAARQALRLLDEALLSHAPGDVLDLIFSRFCIGK